MLSVNGQNCIPDTTLTQQGIHPDHLDTAREDSSYQQVLQVKAVRDTTVVFQGTPIAVVIDSIIIDEIIGLPASFSYACNPVSCVFSYQAIGCVVLNGQPKAEDVGVHPLQIVVTSYVYWSGLYLTQTDTLTDFTLVVVDSSFNNIVMESSTFSIYPNPGNGSLITVYSKAPMKEIRVIDRLGRQVEMEKIDHLTFKELSLGNLPDGSYTIQVTTEQGVWVKKYLLIH